MSFVAHFSPTALLVKVAQSVLIVRTYSTSLKHKNASFAAQLYRTVIFVGAAQSAISVRRVSVLAKIKVNA